MFCYSDTALQLLWETVEKEEQNILVESTAAKGRERFEKVMVRNGHLSLSLTAVLSTRKIISSFSDPVQETAGCWAVVWRLNAAIFRPAVNSTLSISVSPSCRCGTRVLRLIKTGSHPRAASRMCGAQVRVGQRQEQRPCIVPSVPQWSPTFHNGRGFP